jgi:hypothetical protein
VLVLLRDVQEPTHERGRASHLVRLHRMPHAHSKLFLVIE